MRTYKPIEIARQLNISTSVLRHYESWGIVPAPDRTASGYRMYTEEHAAYFACIRNMLPGFGMDVAKQTMRYIMQKQVEDALWLVNERQAALHQDKMLAEKTIDLLNTDTLAAIETNRYRKWMTIGEIAAETGVPTSAIRHWEREGLLHPPRDEDNGYRRFNHAQYRQILIIRTLRSANHPLEVIKQVMKELDHHNIEQAREIAGQSITYLDHLNRHQMQGIHALVELCRVTELM